MDGSRDIALERECEYSWGSKLIPGNKTHQSRMMSDVDVNEWMTHPKDIEEKIQVNLVRI